VTTVFEVDEEAFAQDVLQRSYNAPVVVDFWAAWCGPCRVLGPVLERLANEAKGAWSLAKVDVDRNPRLAQAFGIQGIPAVRAFRDGKQVAEFTGALPEAQVRQWLATLGPSQADETYDEGAAREDGGDLDAAAAAYRRALDLEPGHADARRGLARVELRLRAREHGVGGMEALRARAEADPLDVPTVLALADLELVEGRAEAAFARLLEIVRRGPAEDADAARRHLLAAMDALPADDPRVTEARRALSRALF
jgi:putative thioredoxin